MRSLGLLAVLLALLAVAAVGLVLSSSGGSPPAAADGDTLAAIPSPTWERYCELGPPPGEWESWEAFLEYGRGVIEKYGPPPTPQPVPFDEAAFKGPAPLGFSSWKEFAEHADAIRDELDASGAKARANCTGKQVCVQTSQGPVCVAPAGEPGQICLGDGCPTPDRWRS